MNKQQQAEEVARLIHQASLTISTALEKLEEYDLNLENYPENWLDFNEHPLELNNILVSDMSGDSGVQVEVGQS